MAMAVFVIADCDYVTDSGSSCYRDCNDGGRADKGRGSSNCGFGGGRCGDGTVVVTIPLAML